MEALEAKIVPRRSENLPATIPKGCSAAGTDLVEAAGGIGFTAGAAGGLKPEAAGSNDLCCWIASEPDNYSSR
jgi:hypothetical protein